MEISLSKDWKKVLGDSLESKEFQGTCNFVEQEYQQSKVFPPKDLLFEAFEQTPYAELKVVIIGQDPYHKEGQAHGLAFSVPAKVTPPPSLKNIYKEIQDDCGIQKDTTNGDLSSWAQQGVLLLNSVLSVEEARPGSHAKKGWEEFTDKVIQKISEQKDHCVFIIWGSYAQKKGRIIDRSKHLVIESAHPSPLSSYRGFFGSKPFSKTNAYLAQHGKEIIQW